MRGQSQKVKVKFYSGYKGEETPMSVLFKDKELSIDRILERKKILDQATGEVREEYRIKLNGRLAILKVYGSKECELLFL